MKFSKKEMQKASKKIRKSIIKGDGRPSKIKMVDTNGKTHKLKTKEYLGLFKQYNLFRLNHGRFPNTVTYVGKAKEPTVMNYQDDSVSCGPASFNMIMQALFDWNDESTIKKIFGTTSTGTAPDMLINGAGKLGYDVTVIPRNRKAVQKAISKGYPVLAHIDTLKAPCLEYSKNYGHWITIQRVTKAGNYRVYDPTKGVHSCKPECIDNAMLNRTINYYQVKPRG